MKAGRLLSLGIAFLLLATVSVAAGATPQAGPCASGMAYDPACDVNRDGQITITDIQLTAGHWNQNGTWVGDNNHTHLGQTWTGANNPLKIEGSFHSYPESAALVLSNSYAYGTALRVGSTGGTGAVVDSAGDDGVNVVSAGNPTTQFSSLQKNGFEVAGAEGNGLFVGRADWNGVLVGSANNGVTVDSASYDGLAVGSVGWDGVSVVSAGNHGLTVYSAGNDGVNVVTAGNPTNQFSSWQKNGFEVAGAEGVGLWVGRADAGGVFVDSAGADGVLVNSASNDGLSVLSAGIHGVNVSGAGGYGVRVGSTGLDGVQVTSAGWDGLSVRSAVNDGVNVVSAGSNGVYANTTQVSGEWGFYTDDKIHGSNVALSSLTLIAQVTGTASLTPGDVVAAAGLAAPLPDSHIPLPQVRLADRDTFTSIVGVVEGRMAITPKAQPAEESDAEVVLELRSANGPAQPGDYVAITVLGAAQVKVAPGEAIQPGQRLTVSATPGQARALQSKLIEGMMVTEGASVIGAALEAPKDGMVWVLVNPQ